MKSKESTKTKLNLVQFLEVYEMEKIYKNKSKFRTVPGIL